MNQTEKIYSQSYETTNTLTSSYSFLSHAYSLSKVEAWLPEFIQKFWKRLFVRSSVSSLEFAPRGFLDEDERDDIVRCQVKYFTDVWSGSRRTTKNGITWDPELIPTNESTQRKWWFHNSRKQAPWNRKKGIWMKLQRQRLIFAASMYECVHERVRVCVWTLMMHTSAHACLHGSVIYKHTSVHLEEWRHVTCQPRLNSI